MSASGRIPRLCAGDSPAECLKAARRFMREARAHAEAGDRIAAGTALAAACSTGAYLLPGAPAGMLLDRDSPGAWTARAPKRIYQDGAADRLTPFELAANRIEFADGGGEDLGIYRLPGRIADEEREEFPKSAERELEECYLVAIEADAIMERRERQRERDAAVIASRLGTDRSDPESEAAA